jgi:inhibitor of KinA
VDGVQAIRSPQFFSEGDSAIRISFADAISREAIDAVRRYSAALTAANISWVRDVVAAYTTVTVYYAPEDIRYADAEAFLAALPPHEPADPSGERTVEIPVCYGGEFGPDLEALAKRHGIAAAEAVSLHEGADYLVAAVGFVPGFAYLYGLPEALATPRLATPRPRVPAGSVAIGGGQTGIYPLETPGGWQVIGRTPLRMFDAERRPAAILSVGDTVRFRAIDPAEFGALAERERLAANRAD